MDRHTLGISPTAMNNAWPSPLPLAPTSASYWLWHTATHSRCLAAALSISLSVCLSGCLAGWGTSMHRTRLQQSEPICSHKREIRAGAVTTAITLAGALSYGNRTSSGKKRGQI